MSSPTQPDRQSRAARPAGELAGLGSKVNKLLFCWRTGKPALLFLKKKQQKDFF
jgi:hypothetical protein